MEPLADDQGAPQPADQEAGAEAEEELGDYEGEEEEDADEEMATSDEEYNLTHFGIAQALPVPEGPPDFDAGPPQTAEEYLQWVRYEASRCPRITRKDIDPAKLQQQQQQQEQQQQQQQGEGDGAAEAQGQQGQQAQRSGGGTGGAGAGRRRGGGFSAYAPPPVLSDCHEWARPDAKWLRVFLQVHAPPGSTGSSTSSY
ncbi:hypothetical protein TSOC_004226 [Tetrabaena socialis]|uniref:Uncharacterized protein n=1 Tax=Tetrabaena socialis TaxID=47790 RepID=A0A2J8A9I8_9CHLO|nr:hypothetical protein TSOC_004226 [Tetrabaena socialis]|eukprot:PNH09171.1 hypothetical protein TSOC_004226 [Tetrabaena socialis]